MPILPPLKSDHPLQDWEKRRLAELLRRHQKFGQNNVTSIAEHRTETAKQKHRAEIEAQIDAAIRDAIDSQIPLTHDRYIRPEGGGFIDKHVLRRELETVLGRIRGLYLGWFDDGKFDEMLKDDASQDGMLLAFQFAAEHTARVVSKSWNRK